jgi:hypothetical protein
MVNLDRLLDLPRITQLVTPRLAYGDGIVPILMIARTAAVGFGSRSS